MTHSTSSLLQSHDWPLTDGAAPRFATAPTPGRPHAGRAIAGVAKLLGKPFMPWQRYTANVATERLADPDSCAACRAKAVGLELVGAASFHTCPYAYQVVVVTVPRQSGKTTLIGAVGCTYCMLQPGHGFFYTAQTGKDARERWQDLAKLVAGSELDALGVRPRLAAGKERLQFPNHSQLRVFAPTTNSLHGYTPPTVCLDEAMAHDEQAGDALMAAIGPAQITLPHRQLWIVSTEGTAESVFLARWIEAGRTGADRVAIFDWGIPDGVDIYDFDRLPDYHPAVGFTVKAEDIASQADKMSRAEYERAYGNRRTRTSSSVIRAAEWAELKARQLPPPGAMVLAYDVAHDRSASVIVSCWVDGDGKPQGKVVRYAPGASWLADQLQDYATRWRNVGAVVAAGHGPVMAVTDELRRRQLPDGCQLVQLTESQYVTSWAQLVGHIADGSAGHDGTSHLADAADAVVIRPRGDGSAPSRRNSAGDISPLVAYMVGLWQAQRTHEPQDLDTAFA